MNDAKRNKNDEFYTRLEDIENELKHYKHHFKGKTVYCNADDPRVSNFFRYFSLNFEHLGLRKLITTCYKSTNIETIGTADEEKAVALVYEGAKKNGLVPDIEDIEIKNNKGIYPYILSGDSVHLNLRTFEPHIKKAIYEKQNGICLHCGAEYDIKDMHADHIMPWSLGGKTVPENCQILCKNCNARKSNNY